MYLYAMNNDGTLIKLFWGQIIIPSINYGEISISKKI